MKSFASHRDTAVFLGAGASAAFGYPVTAGLLPAIAKAVKKKPFGKSRQGIAAVECLRRGFDELLPRWTDKQISQPLITDLLSILDQSMIAGTKLTPQMGREECADFRRLLDRILVKVIDDIFYDEADFSDTCRAFIDWVMSTGSGIVTTNYDLEVDMALAKRLSSYTVLEKRFDYGFDWRDPENAYRLFSRPKDPLFRLYKLHGSLNWLSCDVCQHTYINLDGSIQDRVFDVKKARYNTCHCGNFPLSSVIVSPSYVRDVRHPDLLYLWKNALEYLRRAKRWVIVGYSLPPEDLAIRSLLTRAYRARDEDGDPPLVEVVQRSCNEQLQSRYLSTFPEARFHWDGLEGFLREQSRLKSGEGR